MTVHPVMISLVVIREQAIVTGEVAIGICVAERIRVEMTSFESGACDLSHGIGLIDEPSQDAQPALSRLPDQYRPVLARSDPFRRQLRLLHLERHLDTPLKRILECRHLILVHLERHGGVDQKNVHGVLDEEPDVIFDIGIRVGHRRSALIPLDST